MKIVPVSRVGAAYHDKEVTDTFASATALRKLSLEDRFNEMVNYVPETVVEDFAQLPKVDWENYFALLKYKVTSNTIEELQHIFQMNEGFEYRLKEKMRTAKSFAELIEQLQTKRYTKSRIQRMLTYTLMNTTEHDIKQAQDSRAIHVLGFNEQGRAYLSEKKKAIELAVLSKVGRDTEHFDLQIRVDDIYMQGNKKFSEQNFGRRPIKS
jgi:predicted nucleotidyltransferase